MCHPVVGADRVGLHQRHDHEAASERERAHLERRPQQRAQPPRGRDGCQRGPGLHRRARGSVAAQEQLDPAAGEQHQHQPRPGHRGGDAGGKRIGRDSGAPGPSRARPDRAADVEPGADGHRGDRGAGTHPGSPHPARRRAAQEQHRQGEDRDQARQDERAAAKDRAAVATQTPCAVDRQLRRGRPRQDVDRRQRSLEIRIAQPAPSLHAEFAEQAHMDRRPAEADAPDPAPLAHDRAERRGLAGRVAETASLMASCLAPGGSCQRRARRHALVSPGPRACRVAGGGAESLVMVDSGEATLDERDLARRLADAVQRLAGGGRRVAVRRARRDGARDRRRRRAALRANGAAEGRRRAWL